ncbi:MAG TPA: endo-1,4-beta-xylanase [Planctomicrobium sp.]|nr:endo-1,4-beta-xylanase [Planctomicrobium sp.]
MRFLVHPPSRIGELVQPDISYLSGMDGQIFPTQIEVSEGELSFRRPMSESCKLNICWPVAGFGHRVLTTASLREREQPYNLTLELARGRLSELCDLVAMWQQAGMVIPSEFRTAHKESFALFSQACTSQESLDSVCRLATRSIEKACQASAILMSAYAEQRLANIRRMHHQSPGLLGCRIDGHVLTDGGLTTFQQAFNTASISVNWNDVETREGEYHWQRIDQFVNYAIDKRLILRGGPLIDLSLNGLPTWLAPWSQDFQNLPSFVCDYIETAVNRYQGRIRLWEVAAYGNTGGALGLKEDHCLALVARSLDAARRTDSDAQFFVRVDCPWGEYLRQGNHRLSPLQFVDALVRSNIGLSGVTLDLNVGYSPEGCYVRDMLAISKLIDFWSMLQIQIHVNIACPSAASPDLNAHPRYQVCDGIWKAPWSEETQTDWMNQVIPVLLAKPAVTGVFLSHFHDGVPHRYPHAGLLSVDGTPKPMLESFRKQLHPEA